MFPQHFRYVQDVEYVILTQVLSLISCDSDKGRILTGFTMKKSVFIYGLKWIGSIENGQSLSIDNYGYKTKSLQNSWIHVDLNVFIVIWMPNHFRKQIFSFE